MLPIIRHHHEHFNGRGYPDGLSGEGIPFHARIVAACDAYDALVSDRPYRAGKSPEDAASILAAGAGGQWDPGIVEVLVSEVAMSGANRGEAQATTSTPGSLRGDLNRAAPNWTAEQGERRSIR